MTRVAWFHCFNGIAGDMALGALLDAGADVHAVRAAVGALGLSGWSINPQRTQRCGIGGTYAGVAADDQAHHRPYRDIRRLIAAAPLAAGIGDRALAVFAALAGVEGDIHGVAADDVEFHEVGSLDAIVDVVGTCAALESLGVDEIHSSAVAVGTGTFSAAHGVLPNPGPAVLGLLARRHAPIIGVDVTTELTTPTGAAILSALAAGFGPIPAVNVIGVGYGAGTRDMVGRPNVVQVVIGEMSTTSRVSEPGQPLRLLETNVDDVTGEVLAHTLAALLDGGAYDAWITPILMKKGRPAHTIHLLAEQTRAAALGEILIRATGTLGVRGSTIERWPQPRVESAITIAGLPVATKTSVDGRVKLEHEHVASVAATTGAALRTIHAHPHEDVDDQDHQ
jgi:pyridinium-3,5-bisthiocarboxylic acid mononucleotide nickel chelatase